MAHSSLGHLQSQFESVVALRSRGFGLRTAPNQAWTAFGDADVPHGIHLHIIHDPDTNQVLDAKTFDIVELRPGDQKKLSLDSLEYIADKTAEIKVMNAGIRPLLRQANRKYLKAVTIPEDIFRDGKATAKSQMPPLLLVATQKYPLQERRCTCRASCKYPQARACYASFI
uniref:Uncharacterized protein n=1 Tax=Pyrodinium bahamense TaxID=73915 RepID=A0A7S0FL22_9DINO